jgi:hypothetical protein
MAENHQRDENAQQVQNWTKEEGLIAQLHQEAW